MTVAEVDEAHRVTRQLWSGTKQVLFLNDCRTHGFISQQCREAGLDALQELIEGSEHTKPAQTAALATQVFRTAPNGQSVLDGYQAACGIPVQVITPHLEARLGFRTAYALAGTVDAERLISWDCGAGSFQFSSISHTHSDKHGSGTMLHLSQKYVAADERICPEQYNQMQDELQSALAPVPEWLASRSLDSKVVAIGSAHSIFNQMVSLSGMSKFTAWDVEQLVSRVLGLTQSEIFELEQMVDPRASLQNAAYVVPKLALLHSVMRWGGVERVQYHESNGNGIGMVSEPSLWPQTSVHAPAQQASGSTFDREDLMTVNWHLEKDCNYSCNFCYARFDSVVRNLSKTDGFAVLNTLKDAGVFKINFAGGEPMLNKNLGEFAKHAHQIGLKVSIITNGSLVRKSWLCEYGQFIHQIGVSCDSLDESTNKQVGRGFGHHVHTTKRLLGWVRSLNKEQGLDIKLKINTVVLRGNVHEDWNKFLAEMAPLRWKIFQVLKIQGENDAEYDNMSVTSQQFEQFVSRHQGLVEHGVSVVPENNQDMTSSYMMLSPDGKLYQNSDGKYKYSEPILKVGVSTAMHQVGFDYSKFVKRGGAYTL